MAQKVGGVKGMHWEQVVVGGGRGMVDVLGKERVKVKTKEN